jgi:hypothetical protein
MELEAKRGRGIFDGWSKSSLKSVLDGCSWQWALQRVGGLEGGSTPHSSAGTGMHAAIEEHERQRIVDGTVPDMLTLSAEAAKAAWEDGANIPAQWHNIHGGQGQAADWAVQLTDTWLESDIRQTLLGYTPLAVEPHLETDRVPVSSGLRGYLDWVGRDGDEYVIIDFKSASDLRRWDNPNQHRIESATYLYLAVDSGLVPEGSSVRMEWHIVSRKGDAKILEGPRFHWDEVEFLNARLAEAQHIYDTAAFEPNPSWGLCNQRWCVFYHGCQVTGQLGPDSVVFPAGSVDADSLPAPESAPGAASTGPLSAGAPGATPSSNVPAPDVPGSTTHDSHETE